MGGEIAKPFTWIALFRDGHTIEQAEAENDSVAFNDLVKYMYGTPEEPQRHYLLWFAITDGTTKYTVSFDRDGDAYIDLPDGKMLMTEFKIRSAELLYRMEKDRATGERMYHLGFGGVNTCAEADGKAVVIREDGSYELASELPRECAVITTQSLFIQFNNHPA